MFVLRSAPTLHHHQRGLLCVLLFLVRPRHASRNNTSRKNCHTKAKIETALGAAALHFFFFFFIVRIQQAHDKADSDSKSDGAPARPFNFLLDQLPPSPTPCLPPSSFPPLPTCSLSKQCCVVCVRAAAAAAGTSSTVGQFEHSRRASAHRHYGAPCWKLSSPPRRSCMHSLRDTKQRDSPAQTCCVLPLFGFLFINVPRNFCKVMERQLVR